MSSSNDGTTPQLTTYETDDLNLAATLCAMGASVTDIRWRPEKRLSDVILDLQRLDMRVAAQLARHLADRLDKMAEQGCRDTDIAIAFRGTIIDWSMIWLGNIRRMVRERKERAAQ